MRPLNLIPPEERRGESAPLRAGMLSYVVIAALAAALVAVFAYVSFANEIDSNKSDIASLQARQALASEQAAGSEPYTQFASLLDARSATVTSLAQSRFDWERVLRELALVIPRDVTLKSLSARVIAGTSDSASTATSSIAGPSLDITGCAAGQEGVARFLAALKDIDGVTRVGMQSSALGSAADSGAAGGATTPAGGGESDCPSSQRIASFQASVAFDAVPVSALAAPAPITPASTEASTTSSATAPAAGTTTTPAAPVSNTNAGAGQ